MLRLGIERPRAPTAAQGLHAAAQEAVKATHGALEAGANMTVSATSSAATAMGMKKEEPKPAIVGGAWPDLGLSRVAGPIEQARKIGT